MWNLLPNYNRTTYNDVPCAYHRHVRVTKILENSKPLRNNRIRGLIVINKSTLYLNYLGETRRLFDRRAIKLAMTIIDADNTTHSSRNLLFCVKIPSVRYTYDEKTRRLPREYTVIAKKNKYQR